MSKEGHELGHKMRVGAIWTYIQGWTITVIQFLTGIILARLLDPADFGVFFAVTAYTALLAAQVRFGIAQALLQAKDLEEEQWNSAFWMMEAIAVLCALLVFAVSGALADFYDDERYTSLMRLMCISFFIMPFMAINGTLLRRRMDFKTDSQIQVKSALAGICVSLACAFYGLGPYSLALGGLAGACVSAILMAARAPWFPHLSFSLAMLAPLFRYGWRFHLNNSLSMLTKRVDNMMVGRMLDIASLGFYTRAFNLANMPVANICSPLYQLLFSGFSRIQDNMEHSKLMYQKAMCAITSTVYPLLLVLVFAGDELIYFVYGEKWMPAATPMKILAIGFFAQVISITTSSFASAQNLVAKQTPIVVTNLMLTVVAVAVGVSWGLDGVATGISIKMFFIVFLVYKMMRRSHIGLELRDTFTAVTPAAVATLITALACLAVDHAARQYMALSPLTPGYLALMCFSIVAAYSASWLAQAFLFKENVPLQSSRQLAASYAGRAARRLTGKG